MPDIELLVRVVDRPGAGHHLDLRAGDVIAWRGDGAGWGREERRNPEWRIVRVPGLSEAEAEALVAEELARGRSPHEYLLRPRGMRLDLGRPGIPARRGDRDGRGPDLTLDAGAARAAMGLKDPLPRPDLIGPATPHTIG